MKESNQSNDIVTDLIVFAWHRRVPVISFALISGALIILAMKLLTSLCAGEIVYTLQRQAIRQMEDRYLQLQKELENDLQVAKHSDVVARLPREFQDRLTQTALADRYQALCRFRARKCVLPNEIWLRAGEVFPKQYEVVYDGGLGGLPLVASSLYQRSVCIFHRRMAVVQLWAFMVWIALNLFHLLYLKSRA